LALESLQDAISVGYDDDKIMSSFLFKDKNTVFNVDLKQATLE